MIYLLLAKRLQFTLTNGCASAFGARDIKDSGLQQITSINYENNVFPHFFNWNFHGKSEF